jgi:diguanylate cyclase (GGDEF)-like protein
VALKTAERLRRGLTGRPFKVGNERLTVTVSVGVAARKAKETDPNQLLRLADHALYSANAGTARD